MSRGPGRPPLPPEQRRTARVEVWLTQAELERLDALAGPGEKRADTVRRVLRGHVEPPWVRITVEDTGPKQVQRFYTSEDGVVFTEVGHFGPAKGEEE